MQREIEKISILVDNENTVEGILIKCIENNKKKYYSEYVGNKFKEEKDEFYLDEFYLLVTKILFNNNCNKKTEFIHFDDIRYTRIKELIYEHNMTKNTRFKAAVAWSLTCFGFGSPLTGTPSMIYKLLGVSTSIAGLHNINSKIEMFGKSKLKNMLRKFYAITLGLNILSTSIAGYQEFTKTQLERDIEDFIENKDSSIENPFDLDIDYNNDVKLELLMTAIKENPNLEDADKAILYKFKSFFKDNPYVDYKYLYDKFANLGIIYTEEKNEYNDATYFVKDDYIIDYEYIGEGKYHQEEISHLLMGLIGSFEDYPCLSKGMREFLTEYYITKDTSNTYSKTVANFMLETIGKETLLEAYSTSNFGIIEEKLKEINDNEEDYNRLIYILKDPEPYKLNDFYHNDWLDIKNRYDCYKRHYTESKNSGFQKSKTKISQKG